MAVGRSVVRRTWRTTIRKGRVEEGTVEGRRRVGRCGGKVIYLVIIKLPALATRIVVNIQMRLHLWSHKLYVSPPLASCPALCSRISSSFLSSYLSLHHVLMQLENFDFGLYTGEVLACPTTITPTVFFHPYRSHEFPVVFFREVRRTQRGRRKKLGWNWSPLLPFRKIGRDFFPVLSSVFPRYVRKWTLIFTSLFDSCSLTWEDSRRFQRIFLQT